MILLSFRGIHPRTGLPRGLLGLNFNHLPRPQKETRAGTRERGRSIQNQLMEPGGGSTFDRVDSFMRVCQLVSMFPVTNIALSPYGVRNISIINPKHSDGVEVDEIRRGMESFLLSNTDFCLV